MEAALPAIQFKPLSVDPGGAFRCGEAEIDRWFKNCLKKHTQFKHRVTTAHLPGDSRIIGFYALSVRMESDGALNREEKQLFRVDGGKFAAVGFDYVAVRKDLQKQGIGTIITGRVIDDFARIASMCGIEFLIGCAINKGAFTGFYEPLGFKQYGPLNVNRPQIFLPAQSAIDLIDLIAAEKEKAAARASSLG